MILFHSVAEFDFMNAILFEPLKNILNWSAEGLLAIIHPPTKASTYSLCANID